MQAGDGRVRKSSVSSPPSADWQDQLQASLRRAQDAIARGVTQHDALVRDWTAGLRSAYPNWGRERWQRKLERKLRKRAERESRIANATLVEGYLWMVGAIILCIAALSTPPFGLILLFPAVRLGTRGARVIARHTGTVATPGAGQGALGPLSPLSARQAEGEGAAAGHGSAQETQVRDRAQRFGSLNPAAGAPGSYRPGEDLGGRGLGRSSPNGADPRDQRVDGICDKILGELRSSPAHVKEIFRKPEETISALRATCRELTRRERDVRRFLAPEEDVRLSREREALSNRVEIETDEVTKLRLASALGALDQQRQQRLDLARSAARFDAEHTRISYTLESLYTQVVRMRSADAGSVDVAGAGLRRSLDLLSLEVDALADALEKVNVGSEEAKLRGLAEAPLAVDAGGAPGARGTREKA
jgi:UPF0716 family protein affecting phage T7 exclusion